MKKSTKIITTAVALALVVAAMVVGIYAATAGSATITANVSWQAEAGITYVFNGSVSGGSLKPAAVTHTVVSSTSNTASVGTGSLNESFLDSSDNGVNDPGAIVYTYSIENTGATAIKIKMTKSPAEGIEGGTTAADHTPAVAYEVTGIDGVDLAALKSEAGVSLGSNATLTVKITLSLASGSDAVTDADLGITSFDAGVAFTMSV